jgi:PAS domain S-box-containing protein
MRQHHETPIPPIEHSVDLLVASEFRERVAHALAVILRSLLIILPLLFLIMLSANDTLQSLSLVGLFLVVLVLRHLRNRGEIALTVYALVLSLIAFGVVDAASYGSIRSAGIIAFVAAVVLGGMFLGLRALIAVVVINALALGGLIYAQRSGWLRQPDYSVGPLQWAAHVLAFSALALNIYYVRSLAIEALARARRALADRDRVEVALRESEERFAKIFRSSPVSLSVVDLKTRELIAVNEAAERIFRSRDLVAEIGASIGTRFWADPEQFRILEERLLAEGRVTNAAASMLRIDGDPFEARLSLELIELGGRKLIINVVEDVSEEHSAREALGRSEREAKFALERLIFAAEAARVYSWIWEPESDQLTFATPPDELLGPLPPSGHYPRFIEMVHPDDRLEHATISERVLNSLSDYEREFRIVRTDGDVRWLMSRGRAYGDGAGRPTHMAGIAVDISARKQAEVERRALEGQLRESQKLEAIGTLAGGIAHDFNNILGAILGNLALARKDVGANSRALVSLEEINKASVRAKNLVQQILTFSRRQSNELIEQSLQPILEEAIGLLRVSLPAGIELGTHFDAEPLYVRTDATQVGQVLMNLCTNAWHAMNGRNGRIVISLHGVSVGAAEAERLAGIRPGRYARLSVSDDGEGMDAARQKRIFEPFYTTKPVGQGTGLGLAVVHGIVTAHNGAITVSSAPGAGTRVQIYLPLAAAPAELAPIDMPPLQPIDGKARHVVYIDDDEAMVFLVTRMLEDQGFRVSGYERGELALDALRARLQDEPSEVDLIVTDYNMPGFSGLDVARELARMRPEIPVILTSGYVTEDLRTEARLAGVRHVIYKPNTIYELCEVIQRLLSELVS